MDAIELEAAIAALGRDWSVLAPRLRQIDHEVATDHARLSLRLHYPALRDAQATVGELVDVITLFMTHFSLPRKQVQAVYARKDTLDPFSLHTELSRLNQEAITLFKRVRTSANSGEAGELLLYLLTEWVLGAPQIIAKMSLKTSAQVAVHGADGVHVKFVPGSGQLLFYSGEAKLSKRVDQAIASAVDSIGKALSHEKTRHELELVRRNINFAGLEPAAEEALLKYLDPFDEAWNARVDVITCLIGFDFAGYAVPAGEGDPDKAFEALARAHLEGLGPKLSRALIDAGLAQQRIELFLLPVPSVDDLRDRFQDRIGWGKP